MEHEDGGDDVFDWKYWRRFEATNRERAKQRKSLMAEEREGENKPA